MLTLVIETSTAACSVALAESGSVVAARFERVGRGHAELLVPMIAALPDGGRAEAIMVGCGPGSFTGVRVGIAAARALGLAWNVPVTGFSSLALVAAGRFAASPGLHALAVVQEAGHGEVFMQAFVAPPLAPVAPPIALSPTAAADAIGTQPVFGSGVGRMASVGPGLDGGELLPIAADAVLLPPELVSLPPRPIYGRPPDATLFRS